MRVYTTAFVLITAITSPKAPSFDVASVKANTSGSHIYTGTGLRNSRYSLQNAILRSLLATAFRIPGSQIVPSLCQLGLRGDTLSTSNIATGPFSDCNLKPNWLVKAE